MLLLALCFVLLSPPVTNAQTEDEATNSPAEEAEPTEAARLFEQGQDAHARGDFQRALELYNEAIRLRPEFPEAEYQRGAALVSLGRAEEAERALRRAIELRADWVLPHAALGVLLARAAGREREAETVLRRALELQATNAATLMALARLRARAGDSRAALELLQRATASDSATASAWTARAAAERAAGDREAALTSLERAVALDSDEAAARIERAEIFLAANETERALADLRAARSAPAVRTDAGLAIRLAALMARAGDRDEAVATLDALVPTARDSAAVVAARTALTIEDETSPAARVALEQLLTNDPRNAALLARLGASYRTSDPARSLDYYRRAAEIEPGNIDYATGYAAALVQARRFAEAVALLRRIIAVAPDTYAARANLATALGELQQHREALVEYQWLNRARPDLAVTYYFVGRTHDLLEEYPQALAAYEAFLARADAQQNNDEIERVRLRLPLLREQVRRGAGNRRRR